MTENRRFIVDTDTGSDDVWAIIEALRAEDVGRVEAITVVCGNFPLDLCVKNALIAVDEARTYAPPVYRGMERPLLRKRSFYADYVHGKDGLGNMAHPAPAGMPEKKHAVDAIIELVMAHPGEIEIVTCGPLTNIAMALLKEPHLAENIRKLWILGGSAGPEGNMTPAGEYNVYTDPEAASIVLESGADSVWVAWDTSRGAAELTAEDVARLENGGPTAQFCARCTASLREYYRKLYGRSGVFSVVDSLVVTAALYPDIMQDVYRANCAVELHGTETRGYFRTDSHGRLGKEPNAAVCPRVDAARYKEHLFRLLGAG